MATTAVIRRGPPEQKVREKLHSAAARVFARKGYATATVREIVEMAGVTKPALYYYFGSKEGVYKAILEVWQALPPRSFPNYAPGTWGPREADELMERDGREWRKTE